MRQAVWLLAAAGFIASSLHLAAPLHAAHSMDHCRPRHDECSKDPAGTDHDADKCGICHFLFGLAGKTLPAQIAADISQPVAVFFEGVASQTLVSAAPTCRIIPRAPPGA